MKTTANRKDRRAAKSVAAKVNPKVKADKSNANPAAPVANTAQERIAAMGDNLRPFYTAINDVVVSIHTTEVQHKAVSDNQSLDLLVSVFAAREHFSLSDLVKGTKLTPSAKAVQSIWLQTYVPAYHDALRASEKKAEGKDYYSREASQQKIDNEAAAAESIRVMFERVFMAAYWLEYIEAKNIGTAKKGRTRGLTYEYPTEEHTTAADGTKTTKIVHVTGIDSVTALTASGRARVQAVKTAEGTSKGGAKGKGSKKKAAAAKKAAASDPAVKLEGQKAILAGASNVAQALASTTGDALKTLAASPETEVLLCNTIAARFGKRNKLGKLTSVDIGEVFQWLKTQTYFADVVFTGHATTAEIIKPADAKKTAAK